MPSTPAERRASILRLLGRHEWPLTPSELAEYMHTGVGPVRNDIKALIKVGAVEKAGFSATGGQCYRLAPEAQQ